MLLYKLLRADTNLQSLRDLFNSVECCVDVPFCLERRASQEVSIYPKFHLPILWFTVCLLCVQYVYCGSFFFQVRV